MSLIIDRRQLIVTGTLGLAALSIPGLAAAQALLTATGFTHNVASGEPGAQSVLLWTRYVPSGAGPATVRVELSENADFAKVAGGGEMTTGPWRDHTVKLVVTGLKPGTRYHFRFIAADGTRSPVGRTKTLPDTARRLKIAVFSCSNIGFGWFNAYGHAAAQGDFDLSYHLGDYFYEYGPGTYPVKAEMIAGRDMQPTHEILTLADYRLRYASYRADADLQALHAAMPMIVSMDDHESANDSWEGGAQNHQPTTEGDWSSRKMAAIQAWREWMPVSDEPWAAYDLGGLGSLYRTDTRLAARSRQPEITPEMRSPAALAAFRDGAWRDSAATMMGSVQEAWLAAAMTASVRAGRRWQVVGFGTNIGLQRTPANALDWLPPTASEGSRTGMANRVAQGAAGLPSNMDNWGGYPAARARFLKSVQGMGADTIVITGDSHNAWAFDLIQDGRPAGVELGGQGVTSPGIESATRGTDPNRIARDLVAASPELKWCDTARRGYMALTLTPDRADNEWLFWDSVATRSLRPTGTKTASVTRGARKLTI